MSNGIRRDAPSADRRQRRRLWLRLLVTLGVVVAYRVGAAVPLPGVNVQALVVLQSAPSRSLSVLDVFSGGAFSSASIMALGVMPYITTSIVLQLMENLVPALKRLKADPVGRARYAVVSRNLAVGLAVVEAVLTVVGLEHGVLGRTNTGIRLLPALTWATGAAAVVTLTVGFLALLWLARVVTERGVGNGMSILVLTSVVASLVPSAERVASQAGPVRSLLLINVVVLIVAVVVVLTLAERPLPVFSVRTGRLGNTEAAVVLRPLAAGVVPVIFATAVLGLASTVARMLPHGNPVAVFVVTHLTGRPTGMSLAVTGVLVMGFTYVYTAMQYHTGEFAEDLMKRGMYLAGARPGQATAHRLAWHLSRMAVAGGVALALLAALPSILTAVFNVPVVPLAGTSLLIVVTTTVEAANQYRAHHLLGRYEAVTPSAYVPSGG